MCKSFRFVDLLVRTHGSTFSEDSHAATRLFLGENILDTGPFDDYYEDLLFKLNAKYKDLLLDPDWILQMICVAKEPLLREELSHVAELCSRSETAEIDACYGTPALEGLEATLEDLKPFCVRTEPLELRPSAKEYLERVYLTWSIHARFVKLCIQSLALEYYNVQDSQSKGRGNGASQAPFYWYAAKYWIKHARESYDLTCDKFPSCLRRNPIRKSCPRTYCFVFAAYLGLESAVRGIVRNWELDLNVEAGSNQSALIVAARNGHLNVVELLLHLGVDLTLTDNCGMSALSSAARCGHSAVVDLLVNPIVDLSASHVRQWNNPPPTLNTGDKRGWTPLMYAAVFGHVDIVKRLLEANADSEIKSSYSESALDLVSVEQEILFSGWIVHGFSRETLPLFLRYSHEDTANCPFI